MIINLYTNKGNLADLTDLQHSRLAEIEMWLLWRKIRNITHYSQHHIAMNFLQALLNPEEEQDFITMSKLTDYLTKSEILVPSQNEMSVYLRFQGLGLNKVSRISGRQHKYLQEMLTEYDTNLLIPALSFDFKLVDHPKLTHNINEVLNKTFHVYLEEFYHDMDIRQLKIIERNKFFNR